MLITALVLSRASNKIVWEKLTSAYKKKNIQSKSNVGTNSQNIRYKDSTDLQKHLIDLGEIGLDLSRLNDLVTGRDKRKFYYGRSQNYLGSLS